MMTIELSKWDSADILDSQEAVAAYLEAVLEEQDPGALAYALDAVARTKGLTGLTPQSGFGEEGLQLAPEVQRDLPLSSILSLFKALGLTLSVRVAPARTRP
jgi:probable addiction module antidote protein